MRHTTIALFGVCLLVATAGCLGPDATPTSPSNGGGTSPDGHLTTYLDSYEVTTGTHTFGIIADFKSPFNDSLEPTTFNEVMLCLYDENRTILNQTSIGDLSSPTDEARAIVSAKQRPKYIVVDHPQVRTYGETYLSFIRYEGDMYYEVWNPSEHLGQAFGYPRHNETGRCM